MILESQRHLFNIPDDVAYFNTSYLSPQLHSVRAAGEAALQQVATPWTVTPGDFFTRSEQVRGLFAGLIGAPPDGIAIVPAVSYANAIAAKNLEVAPGQTILVLDEQFPSNVYPWWDKARQSNADLIVVPRPANHDWTSTILEHIDERLAIAALPNCHWTDGGLVDLVAVGKMVREVGAALVVDASQSLGALPLDVGDVQPDFLCTVGYKWMLGPYSYSYLYVGPERRGGEPIEQGWITRKGSEDFTRLVDYETELEAGATRFDVGERSNFILTPMAEAALTQIGDWGIENIADTIARSTAEVERRMTSLGLDPIPAGRRGPHMTGVYFPNGVPVDLGDRLRAAGVYASIRGDSLRLSPHLFTTEADLDRLSEVVAAG